MFSFPAPSLSTCSALLISFQLMCCENTDVAAAHFYIPIYIVLKQSLVTLEALSLKKKQNLLVGDVRWLGVA